MAFPTAVSMLERQSGNGALDRKVRPFQQKDNMIAWMDTHEHNIPPIEDARFNAMLTVAQRQDLGKAGSVLGRNRLGFSRKSATDFWEICREEICHRI